MIKFIVKCVIVLLATQSAMDYLRQEEIIEGSIKINYQTVQQKLLAVIPTEKIKTGIIEFAANKVHDSLNKDNQGDFQVCRDQYREEIPRFKIVNHVVDDGETLDELSQRYGVHWRVIQKVNHLSNEHKLFIGQKLRIPSKMHKLI